MIAVGHCLWPAVTLLLAIDAALFDCCDATNKTRASSERPERLYFF